MPSFDIVSKVDAQALDNAVNVTTKEITTFIQKEIVCQYRVFRQLVINGGPKNKGVTTTFTKKYRIKWVQILAYNLKANSIIKQGHYSISKALI